MRRELLKATAAGGVGEPFTTQRMADTAAHLAFGAEGLEAAVQAFRPREEALLREMEEALKLQGLPLPKAAAPLPDGPPDAGYEDLTSRQAACISALAASAGTEAARANADRLMAAAIGLDAEVRESVRSHVARAIAEMDAAPATEDETTRAPTPEEFTAYLKPRLADAERLAATKVNSLAGINAKDISFIEIEGYPAWPGQVVLRRDRHFSPGKTSVAPEYGLLSALHAQGLAVPKPLFVEPDSGELHCPFIITTRCEGGPVTAEELGPAGRSVAEQMAQQLAAIHKARITPEMGLGGLHDRTVRERTEAMVRRYYEAWKAERVEHNVTVEAGYSWLLTHLDMVSDDIGLIHGDFDLRNLLIAGDRVTAVLDWELAHIGNPGEDMGYARSDIEHLVPWPEFLAMYRAAGGADIPEETVKYFEVWGDVFRFTACTSAFSGYCTGVHHNIIYGSVSFLEFPTVLDRLAAHIL